MTQTESLPTAQIRTLTIALGQVALSQTGWVMEMDLRVAGAGLPQLRALVSKGRLVRELRVTGRNDLGAEVREFFYSVAE